MERSDAPGPLHGVKAIDLTRIRSGPTAMRIFADWGADVIKVEAPGSLDDGDPVSVMGRDAGDFQNLHRGKRGIALNLKDPRGREILFELAKQADVVIENFRPDVKHRLGIAYEDFRAVNPRVIYTSISGFGQDGPYRDRAGFDQIAQGMGGLMSITGLPGAGPVRAGIPIADLGAGIFGAMGTLLALYERERSGLGQWVQTSLLEAQIALLDFQATRWLVDREVPRQAGNDHPTSAPTSVYPTADGHINIAAAGQAMWHKLCGIIGRTDQLANPDFHDDNSRARNRTSLNTIIAEATRTRSSAEWIEEFSRAGIPCGPINLVDAVFADPQVAHLGIVQSVEHPKKGRLDLVGQPMRLSRTPSRLSRSAPLPGEHTAEVLTELGYDSKTIDELSAAGVI